MERYENFIKNNDLFMDDDEKPKKAVESKMCILCGTFVSSMVYDSHVNQCKDESKQKLCSNCGKSISSSSFILHEAQCLKLDKHDATKSTQYNLFSGSSKDNKVDIEKLESFKKNSFMILKHDSEEINISKDANREDSFFIIDGRSAEQKSNEINYSHLKENSYKESDLFDLSSKDESRHIRKQQEENLPSKYCRYCHEYFPTTVYLELHENSCGGNNDMSIENELSIEYSPRINNYNRIESISNINFEDPNLGYEELLRLDEKITHPLSKTCLSMLHEENITSNQISKLEEEYRKCLICFEDFENGQKIVRLPCFHIFHSQDIFKWLDTNKTCPVCRCELEEILK